MNLFQPGKMFSWIRNMDSKEHLHRLVILKKNGEEKRTLLTGEIIFFRSETQTATKGTQFHFFLEQIFNLLVSRLLFYFYSGDSVFLPEIRDSVSFFISMRRVFFIFIQSETRFANQYSYYFNFILVYLQFAVSMLSLFFILSLFF